MLFFFLISVFCLVQATTVNVPCPKGTFGDGCKKICHCLNGEDWCRSEDGRCTDGRCSFGWFGQLNCQHECPVGFFGFNCSWVCHCPKNDKCDRINGLCSSNTCSFGWGGPSCQRRLPILNDPPRVLISNNNQLKIQWLVWISGQTGVGQGPVIGYILQMTDNKTRIWTNIATLRDSDRTTLYTHQLGDSSPNVFLKFRVQLIYSNSNKPLLSIPGPENPNWISAKCRESSDAPTNISAELPKDKLGYVKVTWESSALLSDRISEHQISLSCFEPSKYVPTVSVLPNYTANVTVSSLNDAGMIGSSPRPFHFTTPRHLIKSEDGSEDQILNSSFHGDNNSFSSVSESPKTTDLRLGEDHANFPHFPYSPDRTLNLLGRNESQLVVQPKLPNQELISWNSVHCLVDVVIVAPHNNKSFQKPPNILIKQEPKCIISIHFLSHRTEYQIDMHVAGEDSLRPKVYSARFYTAFQFPKQLPPVVIGHLTGSNVTIFFQNQTSERHKRQAPMSESIVIVVERLRSDKRNRSIFQFYVNQGKVVQSDASLVYPSPNYLLDKISADETRLPFYVAAQFDSKRLPRSEFVVGDGQFYGENEEYENAALKPNTVYIIWIGLEQTLNGLTRRTFTKSEPIRTSAAAVFEPFVPPQHEQTNTTSKPNTVLIQSQLFWSTSIIILLVVGFLLLILLLFLLALCLWKRLKHNRQEFERCVDEKAAPNVVDRHLAVSYLNSFLIPNSRRKCFDTAAAETEDFSIPEPSLAYETHNIDRTHPIPVRDLRSYCEQYLWVDSNRALSDEYRILPSSFTDSINIAILPANVIFNRSPQVVPYDRNRVRIDQHSPRGHGYINASYVRTIGRSRCIVTQCPTLLTAGHFWQMVWGQKVTTIVILMKTEGSHSLDFDCYWPPKLGGSIVYDEVRVEFSSCSNFAHYNIRHFKVSRKGDGEKSNVFHWQFTSWSKNGIPEHPVLFLGFIKRIREERESESGNVLVHCRTGGGRSGLYLAIDTLLTQGYNIEMVDVLRCVSLLRSERSNMVKSIAQYRFVYECLAEEFDHSMTRYVVERFVLAMEGVEKAASGSSALSYEHQVMLLPYYIAAPGRPRPADQQMAADRTFSLSHIATDSDDLDPYVALFVDGFVRKNVFVASRCPSDVYREDFWNIVIDNNVSCLVMLNKMSDLRGAQRLFPQPGRSINCAQYVLYCKSVRIHPNNIFIAYNLRVWLRHLGNAESQHHIRLYEFNEWPAHGDLPSLVAFLELFDQLRIWQNKFSVDRPIVIFSCCGYDKCRAGMFIVLWLMAEQAEKEGIVDVLCTTRLVRSYIPTAINTHEEYKFVYRAIRDYLSRNIGFYQLPVEHDADPLADSKFKSPFQKPRAFPRTSAAAVPKAVESYCPAISGANKSTVHRSSEPYIRKSSPSFASSKQTISKSFGETRQPRKGSAVKDDRLKKVSVNKKSGFAADVESASSKPSDAQNSDVDNGKGKSLFEKGTFESPKKGATENKDETKKETGTIDEPGGIKNGTEGKRPPIEPVKVAIEPPASKTSIKDGTDGKQSSIEPVKVVIESSASSTSVPPAKDVNDPILDTLPRTNVSDLSSETDTTVGKELSQKPV